MTNEHWNYIPVNKIFVDEMKRRSSISDVLSVHSKSQKQVTTFEIVSLYRGGLFPPIHVAFKCFRATFRMVIDTTKRGNDWIYE